MVADYLFTLKGIDPESFKKYPVLDAYIKKIFGLEKLKDYIKKRPQSHM